MPEVLVAVQDVRGEVLLKVLKCLLELVAGVEVLEVVSAQQLVNAPLVPAVGRVPMRLVALKPDALGQNAQHVHQEGIPSLRPCASCSARSPLPPCLPFADQCPQTTWSAGLRSSPCTD
jgi:hypothetical protein